jgi:2-keto-4-pentenoate hydratase/2-oxohepta-3-ene-1,7-dioic acid hydratase in catechol pathway
MGFGGAPVDWSSLPGDIAVTAADLAQKVRLGLLNVGTLAAIIVAYCSLFILSKTAGWPSLAPIALRGTTGGVVAVVASFSHIKEGGREPPPKPIIFTRYPNSQVGHGQAMVRPNASATFDYEGELAVIIGRTCRHVKKEDWEGVVAGYSCYNDGSIREWQRHSSQFIPGKNFYKSGAFGPWMVTPEEAGDVTKAHLMSRLNGVEQQHATIDDLCFDIPAR